jgi:dipeptidyl aminopeptidase/acylaminoacyl peptidase
MSSKRARFTLLIVLSALLLAALPTSYAQDVTPSYQALVRFEDQYHLWDVATGDLTLLPGLTDVEWTSASWSPDGAYLLVSPYGEDNCCSGLYDVERQEWDTQTFGREAVWSPTGRYIISARDDENSAELVLNDWLTGVETKLHVIETQQSRFIFTSLEWSPDEQTIFFVSVYDVTGGSMNFASLYHLPSGNIYELSAGMEVGNVDYYPVWSPNGEYLLLRMEIVSPYTSFNLAQFDVGDIYLINAHTGERNRITHTLYEYEMAYSWSEDGETIRYVIPQTVEIPLDEAVNMADFTSESDEISKLPLLEQEGFTMIDTSLDKEWQVWIFWNGCTLISLNVETEASFQLGVSGQDCQPTLFIEWRPVPPPDTAD